MLKRYQNYERTISIQEAFFYGFFFLLSVTKGLGFYEWQKVFILLVIPALILGFLKVLFTPYTKGQAVVVALVLLLTAVVFWQSHQIAVFFVVFTVLGMKGMSVKKVSDICVYFL